MKGWRADGRAVPSSPVVAWAEDLSRLVLKADTTRIRYSRITARSAKPRVLN